MATAIKSKLKSTQKKRKVVSVPKVSEVPTGVQEIIKVESPSGKERDAVSPELGNLAVSLPMPAAIESVGTLSVEQAQEFFSTVGPSDSNVFPLFAVDTSLFDLEKGLVSIDALFATSSYGKVSDTGLVSLVTEKDDFISITTLLEPLLKVLEEEKHRICFLEKDLANNTQTLGLAGKSVSLGEGLEYFPCIFFNHKEGGRGIQTVFLSYFPKEKVFGPSPVQAKLSTDGGIKPSARNIIKDSQVDEFFEEVSALNAATLDFFEALLAAQASESETISLLNTALNKEEDLFDENGEPVVSVTQLTSNTRTLKHVASYCVQTHTEAIYSGTFLGAWLALHTYYNLQNRGLASNDHSLLWSSNLRNVMSPDNFNSLLERQWGRYGGYITSANHILQQSVALNNALYESE